MNCKPPCMAIVIRSDYPEMIGMPVDVTSESVMFPALGFCWVVNTPRPIHCWNFNEQRDELGQTIAVPDDALRPITGLPVHDEQLDEVTA